MKALLIYCAMLSASLTFAQQGQFRRPVSNSDARIGEIQNKLLTVQNDIAKLNVAMLEGNNSNALQMRLAALESEFQNLRRALDNQRREGQNENGKYDVAIQQLTNFYNQLDRQMRSLQESIKKKMNDDGSRRIPDDIIENIKSHQFAEADKKISEMGSLSPKIKMIVHHIYANNIGNFALLRDYSEASRKIPISYSILSALWYEMKANGHMDVYKLMPLYATLSKEVIKHRTLVSDELISDAIKIRNEISNAIVTNAAEILKAAVHAGNYENNNNIKTLANALDALDRDVSDDTMRKVIDDVYDVTPKDKLVRYMYDNDMIPQIVGAMVHIFRKFQQKGHVDDPATMSIAHNLKRLKEMKNYDVVSNRKKGQVEAVINDLPKSVYALYFAEKLCIRNVHYTDEEVYSPNKDFQWNSDRRYVFTWGGGYSPREGEWFAKHYEDFTFQFVNKEHSNEYMYVPEIESFNHKYRYVMTWMPGGSLGDKSAWRIDLHGDQVSIRNKHFQERLCVTKSINSNWRRYVLTNKEDHNTNASECRWKIEAC